MKVNVLFFGLIKDELQVKELEHQTHSSDIQSLKKELYEKYPKLKDLTHAIAINETISNDNITIQDGDEIAFMPVFSGG